MTLRIDSTADQYLSTILSSGQILRIALLGGGCSGVRFDFTVVDTVTDNDVIISPTVVVDKKSILFLDGASLIYKKSIGYSQLTIESEKFRNTCGCGSSVSL